MAGTTRTVKRMWSLFSTTAPEDPFKVFYEELNKVIADLEVLRVAVDTIADKLDADAGVTDTDYATTAAVQTAAALSAASLSTIEGGD